MGLDQPIVLQSQNISAATTDISHNLCIVSLPAEIIDIIFTCLAKNSNLLDNSRDLLHLRATCWCFKDSIEKSGNFKRFFKMSILRDPASQKDLTISNYLSKFLLHLVPHLTSEVGINKLLVRPSFKDHFAVTIFNLFLQKVLNKSVRSADEQSLIKKINQLKTQLHISIESNPPSTSFEVQEMRNIEYCNPLLELFIELGVDPTAVNRQTYQSLLGEAAALQNDKAISIILENFKNKGVTGEKLTKKLNTQNAQGETALHYLAKSADMPYFNRKKTEDTLKLLLDHGADLHIKNYDGDAPLRNFQTSAGLKQVFNNLTSNYKQFFYNPPLDYKTKKNSKETSTKRFRLDEKLHAAINQSDQDQVKELLKSYENLINYRDSKRGMTPLMHALDCGDLEIVKLILSYGADITLLDDDGCSVIHHCITSGGLKAKAKVDILKDLIQRAEISNCTDMIAKVVDEDGSNSLNMAIEYNSYPLKLVKLLLPYYRDKINEKIYLSMAASIAAFKDQFEVANLLVEEGAEINPQKLYDGQSLLFWAVCRGNVEMTKLLLGFNTNPHELNAKNENGMTILHVAIENQHLEMMKLLLSQGKIDLEIQDVQGHTPLHIAVESGYYEGAKLLTQRGAQIKLTETSKILNEKGSDFDKLRHYLLYVFIKNKDKFSLKLLLNSPFDLHLREINEEFGKSPLIYAGEINRAIHTEICGIIQLKASKQIKEGPTQEIKPT
ncbi:ankyrin repeat domain-containing protein [Candidatus Protochlamydia sp. R18]|uniref:ankyrin repeat domain-containing protein n=1 Tax=Candidatus Protochlamydia sp. R18 TaxID=1353977 RepID=UPI0005A961B2|nr:ankyrin repeat domain-containing protein [Candidatus Protochlamydia sp. R18]